MLVRGASLRVAALAVGLALVLNVELCSQASVSPINSFPIRLSNNEQVFRTNLADPLFTGESLVPGATITNSFYLLNASSYPGYLAVALTNTSGSDPQLMRALTISVRDSAGNQGSAIAANVSPCTSVFHSVQLSANQITRLDVTVQLSSALTGQQAQHTHMGFTVALTLASTDGPAPDGCGGQVQSSDGSSVRTQGTQRTLSNSARPARKVSATSYVDAWASAQTTSGGARADEP